MKIAVIGAGSWGTAVAVLVALAIGTAHGLGYGENTKAALVTRDLAELARLGVALGGDPFTFAGLAGMGDRARPGDLVGELMGRSAKPELHGIR